MVSKEWVCQIIVRGKQMKLYELLGRVGISFVLVIIGIRFILELETSQAQFGFAFALILIANWMLWSLIEHIRETYSKEKK